MEDRGVIYYRRRHGTSASLGNAFFEVQALLEPDERHIVEMSRSEVSRRAHSLT
jgi:hypothetical protein